MRKAIIPLCAVAAASFTSPISAEQYSNPNQAYSDGSSTESLLVSIGHLHVRLQEGERNGSINLSEAREIRQQLEIIDDLSGLGNFTRSDRAFLQRQVRAIRAQIQSVDNGARGRYANWDADDDYILRPPPNLPIDANNDGWDDRDFNRNGYWEDDPQGRGVGSLIESDVRGGGTRVGQRVSSDLYSVPDQHQSQYRDGEDVYYRSDGYRIYEVSRRSHKVTRIFRL